MRLLLLLGALFLAGCGGGAAADNHGYGWTYTAEGESGLRIRYAPAVVAPEVEATLATFEAIFTAAQGCLGRAGAGPLVVIVPRGSLDAGVVLAPDTHVGGRYYFDTHLVVVTVGLVTLPHEFVHHLLNLTGEPEAANRAHDHEAFTRCV